MPREAILLTRRANKVTAEYLPPQEANARYRKALSAPPDGVLGLEIWHNDGGCIRRHAFGKRNVAESAGKSFDDGNKEVTEHEKENLRRQRAGLPTVEEEADLDAKAKAAVELKAKLVREREMEEDERRKSQGRPTVAEDEALAAKRRADQDAAETAQLRAHEEKIRKASGRPSLAEEDAFIEKRRLESLAGKGLAPAPKGKSA